MEKFGAKMPATTTLAILILSPWAALEKLEAVEYVATQECNLPNYVSQAPCAAC